MITGGEIEPAAGQRERLVDGMSLVIGGSAAITAVAAARLGLRVALAAAVGDDAAGDLMLSLLDHEGVDVSAVVIRAGLPTGMTAIFSSGPDRAIFTALGAIASMTAADVPPALLARARHLHVSSYFLLEESLGPGLAGLLAAAHAAGLSTSLDTNDDPSGAWGGRQLRAALAAVDWFLPNEAEAIAIAGHPGAGVRTTGPSPGALEQVVTALTGLGCGVVIKLGARGAIAAPADGGDAYRVHLPPAEPIDTTGAGDCFNAGLIAGLLGALDLPAAAALACAVGAASTQAPGGTGATVSLDAATELARTAKVTRRVKGAAIG